MGYPEFDGFSLQDENFVTSEIEYRTTPNRSLDYHKLSRRSGVKLVSHDFAERTVSMRGYIVGTDASDLQSKIDDLHKNVTRKDDGALYIQSDRSSTATATKIAIADPHYAQDFVPFEVDFLLADPFFYGTQQTATTAVTSGSLSTTISTTISGTVFAEPSVIYTNVSGTGDSLVEKLDITYDPTSEQVTWSGTGGDIYLDYSETVTFDYANQLILEGTSSVDVEGVFSRWQPGSTNFTVTFSGAAVGGSVQLSYQPRYI